jgi:hypothetical protein
MSILVCDLKIDFKSPGSAIVLTYNLWYQFLLK